MSHIKKIRQSIKPNRDASMNARRHFIQTAGLAGGAVAFAAVNRVALAAIPEPVMQTTPKTMPPLTP